MQPFITIVIPVYNVEPYLRRCLDSIVNQTMQDIQIICVNDGSTDGSLGILEEYTERDKRFFIVNQENQGGGSARNAAFPHIRGKYTIFCDPDDWVHLQLCEKLFAQAEETHADMVYYHFTSTAPYQHYSQPFNQSLPKIRTTPEEKQEFFAYTGAVSKLWRTDFLLDHDLKCCEGKRPHNDTLQNWKGVIYAERIAYLDESLYYYFIRNDSYQQNKSNKHFVVIDVMNQISNILHESGMYLCYKEYFLATKLNYWRRWYYYFNAADRRKFRELIRDNITQDDLQMCRPDAKNAIKSKCRKFYIDLLDSGALNNVRFHGMVFLRDISHFLMHKVVRPIKTMLFHPRITKAIEVSRHQ